MIALKEMQDNQFDLAIVDPPYGINMDEQKESFSPSKKGFGNRHRKEWIKKEWDNNIPSKDYFDELMRVSQNQIIWGGNYFIDFLINTRCCIIWDKMQEFSGADFELGWTSFGKSSKAFRMSRIEAYSNRNSKTKDKFIKIHPTQKPVKLYEWLLMNYAKEGDKILDTHLGSGSIAIACHNLGFDLEGYELDKEYFDAAKKRLEQHQAQKRLF
tara:strand:- start:2115 stop:2753 length:639 start_codon:yes stop_codon:yes gene_type:complete